LVKRFGKSAPHKKTGQLSLPHKAHSRILGRRTYQRFGDFSIPPERPGREGVPEYSRIYEQT